MRVQVWEGPEGVPAGWGRCVVTVGVFDGVHRGHRAVVDATVRRARADGVPAVAITFDPHPVAVLRPESAPALLTSVRQRAGLLAAAGVDAVWVVPFTRAFAALEPEAFAAEVLRGRLHAVAVVVGEDFRFGHRAAGDVGLLRHLGDRLGFAVEAVALSGSAGVRWSSTAARQALAEGDVDAAARILGHPPRVDGPVVVGDRRGRALGYPTANLAPGYPAALPADGVYAGWLIRADGTRLPAAVSVGTNPTFDGRQRRVEAYALDRDDLDLYGEHVTVEFTARLRGQERFADVEALRRQMAADVAAARPLLHDQR